MDREPAARYTAALLKSTLLLMGCKPRVAHKASKFLVWTGHVDVLRLIYFAFKGCFDQDSAWYMMIVAKSSALMQASKSLFENMAVKLRAAALHPVNETVETAAHTIKDSNWSKNRDNDTPHMNEGVICTHALQELNLEGRIGVLPGR